LDNLALLTLVIPILSFINNLNVNVHTTFPLAPALGANYALY